MNINHASRLSFNRDFYAIEEKQDGTLDLKVRTLNIFQRVLRILFGAYSDTIWNQSKSTALKNQYPGEWKKIEDSIVSSVVFAQVFKIAKSSVVAEDGDSDNEVEDVEPTGIIPTERPAPATMSSWKKFAREQLQKQLAEKGMEFRESTENGDCFFDSVAYQLTRLGYWFEEYTAQDVRNDIYTWLQADNVPHAKYRKLLRKNHVDGLTYEFYCANIGKCAGNGYNPIWGDTLAAQIVSDIYNFNVAVHEVFLLPTVLLETLEGGQYEDYEYIPSVDNTILICTKLNEEDKKEFVPSPEIINPEEPKGTIVIANISYPSGAWGHFVPVVKAK